MSVAVATMLGHSPGDLCAPGSSANVILDSPEPAAPSALCDQMSQNVNASLDPCAAPRSTVPTCSPSGDSRPPVKRALTIVAAFLVLLCNTQALLAACACPPAQEIVGAEGMPCHVEPAVPAPAMDTCCHEAQTCAANPRYDVEASDPVWMPAMPAAQPPAMPKLVAMLTPRLRTTPPPPSAPIYLIDCCFLN